MIHKSLLRFATVILLDPCLRTRALPGLEIVLCRQNSAHPSLSAYIDAGQASCSSFPQLNAGGLHTMGPT